MFDLNDWSWFDPGTTATLSDDLVLDCSAAILDFTTWNGRKINTALYGRTLYRDGDWNTLFVPFDLTLTGSPLDGAEARALSSASFDAGVLTLTFGDPVATLKAGTPYIIKWSETGSEISEPVFAGVTIDDAANDFVSVDTKVSFVGTYPPSTCPSDDKGLLGMSTGNTLFYMLQGAKISPFSAYFAVETGSDAPILRTVMNFGDGTTGIVSRSADSEELKEYFDLSGRRIFGTPAAKGIYIVNGKKLFVP